MYLDTRQIFILDISYTYIYFKSTELIILM